MKAPVLSILNMKGGVGKTTVSAHIMRVLYHRLTKRVLLVDVDAQFNLTQAVVTQSEYDKILISGKVVTQCFEPAPSNDFFKVKHSDTPPPTAKSIANGLRQIGKGENGRLDLIPGSFDLMKYSMIDDPTQLKHASDYFKRFIAQTREEYDLIVIDCNPSSSFVTKCALENSTHVLSPVKLDKFSIQGVGMVDQLFEHLKLDLDHIILVNGISRSKPMNPVEKDLRAHPKFGPRVLVSRLAHSGLLAAEPTYTGFATDKRGPYSGVVRKEIGGIADEIAKKLGILK